MRRLTPLQFLAEIAQHIPDTWEQTSRFLGAYSSRSRGVEKAKQEASLDEREPQFPGSSLEPRARSSASWARCMKKCFEIDPLVCPKCGSPMKIKSCITDPKEIDRITKNLGCTSQRAPPKLRYSLALAA